MKIKKIFSRLERKLIFSLDGISTEKYMKAYEKWLKRNKMDICGVLKYVHHTVYFDGIDYSKIHITVNANKNTKLTPTALNIVYSPPETKYYALPWLQLWSRLLLFYASYYTTNLYFVYSILQNFSEIFVTHHNFKKTNVHQHH